MAKTVFAACLMLAVSALGNDGSGEALPAGGIQLRRETRISMEKERLRIGIDRVSVEYEFLNTTNEDIATEVLFPLPGANVSFSPRPLGVSGWHVWVEGKERPYETETKAVVKGADQSALLRRFSVDIATFGHFDTDADGKIKGDMQKLTAAQQRELTRAGLLDNGFPTWTVFTTYHWRQTFPAHRILHVKHEYEPSSGLRYFDAAYFQNDNEELSGSCVDAGTRKTLAAAAPKNLGFVEGSIDTLWVDYILTTANTWRTPIKDFELVAERPKPAERHQTYVSFCWDGKVEDRGDEGVVARARNFVPSRELRVMFFKLVN